MTIYQWRILVPSSSAPPSSGTPGLWRSKSGTGGGVDGQGHLLVHPMAWLDERIWGWTRSARRGTNAWAGPKSNDASRIHTPTGSDDESEEEHGDYDDIVGLIPGWVSPSNRKRSRSLANSYADLQQLKRNAESGKRPLHPEDKHLIPKVSLPPLATDPPKPAGQDSPKTSPMRRERRPSLSDKVEVTRLAKLNPGEPFKECTEDINREVQVRRRQTSNHDGANGST